MIEKQDISVTYSLTHSDILPFETSQPQVIQKSPTIYPHLMKISSAYDPQVIHMSWKGHQHVITLRFTSYTSFIQMLNTYNSHFFQNHRYMHSQHYQKKATMLSWKLDVENYVGYGLKNQHIYVWILNLPGIKVS